MRTPTAFLPLLLLLVPLSGCLGGDAPSEPTTSQPPPVTPTGSSPAADVVAYQLVAQGLTRPLYLTHAGDGSGRAFIVEQAGKIRILKGGALLAEPFLDITAIVNSGGNEQGLLSVAFYPDYKTSGRFLVDYTRRGAIGENGDTVIARYKVSNLNPDLADPLSGEILLVVDQPQSNHNGGLIKFGPDGMLYVGMGDGGGASDLGAGHAPEGNGQSLTTLLGKMLRIDVRGEGASYSIPRDNPNLGDSARREIWSYGHRNPWRFSFDRATGDLYMADVGQNAWEEVNHQARSSKGGENYGWPVWEGTHIHRPGITIEHTLPVAEYANPGLGCSVTGGYVYRGKVLPELVGKYVFGDFCSGRIWTLEKARSDWNMALLEDTNYSISSFGEDEAGELYLTDLSKGQVFRFVRK